MNINTLIAAYQEAIQQFGTALHSEVILWDRKDTVHTATVTTAAGMWSLRVTYEKVVRERWEREEAWVARVVRPEGKQRQGTDAEFKNPYFLCWEDAELWCEQQLGFASTPRMLTESDIAVFRAEGRRFEAIVAIHFHDVAHYTDDEHWIVLTRLFGRGYERYGISIDSPEVIGGKGSLIYLQVRETLNDDDDEYDDQIAPNS